MIKKFAALISCLLVCGVLGAQTGTMLLQNRSLKLGWTRTAAGWTLTSVQLNRTGKWAAAGKPSGQHLFIYTAKKPALKPDTVFKTITGEVFPGENYHYQLEQWALSTSPVALNTAGTAYWSYPLTGERTSSGIRFSSENEVAELTTEWSLDSLYPTDIVVRQTLRAKRSGYFSCASPTLTTIPETELSWATVPGYFQGNYLQKNFALAYAYGHGIPALPAVYPERCASTLSPIVSNRAGLSFSVIPRPGLGRDPWEKDRSTQGDWLLGLSHMNRKGALSPTLYYPVLGEKGSKLEEGQTLSFQFRYSITDGDWFKALNHAIYDVYGFKESLALRKNRQSLSRRVERMHSYLTDPATSMWNVEDFENRKIGAQSYLGGVVGSQRDAMKNSDYGAMWMLASLTSDPKLTRDRLPYALNFKLAQQQTEPGFFEGAAVGQYYLAKSKKFVEEWGEVVEPIGLTYYTMLDVGNMLLFEPGNKVLRERLRMGASSLLRWQKADGSWPVAFDRHTEKEVFKDLEDLRPTFYGLLVAYRILGDARYLQAAKKGADWLIQNAVRTGSFLGVCGDARYAPDFATAQTAQCLLDLYDVAREKKYLEAAVATARIYTASIYTHPVAGAAEKEVNGVKRADWEISQSGLSFEHGGIFGSANREGPILLCSHAPLFIRMFAITGEPLFADMARAAALGRDAFVDEKTSVASYYWLAMNKGAGPYPHHAWWQVGWITDYLLSEAELRSAKTITFPRGFVTPKVGPHQTYGFQPGRIYGESAELISSEDLISSDSPDVEYLAARGKDKLFIIVMNDEPRELTATLSFGKKAAAFKIVSVMDGRGKKLSSKPIETNTPLALPGYGLKTLVLE
ncbi:glycerophosphoryl diester phosphodiesterase [Arcticibacter sp. MXS-1]|uniref:glycerophosphoryl diester phosphodiesterase n=1 Tax=Arcticibacter sp. MXS-1 TaxID=3341726 RepID=UPI0035A90054